jgi:hypothetical protein
VGALFCDRRARINVPSGWVFQIGLGAFDTSRRKSPLLDNLSGTGLAARRFWDWREASRQHQVENVTIFRDQTFRSKILM